MKKIFTLIAAGALMIGASYAQRTVDIETTLTEPMAGSTITSGVPFDVEFTVTNNGPDSVKAGDTLTFFLILGNTLQFSTVKVLTTTTDLAMGASANFSSDGLQVTGSQGGNLNLCALVVLNQKTGVDTVKDNVAGGNNASCVQVVFANPSSIGDEFVVNGLVSEVYPNPASTNAMIKFNSNGSDMAAVVIYDLSGKRVYNTNFQTLAGINEKQLDLTQLKSGVYFYEISVDGRTNRDKLIISK